MSMLIPVIFCSNKGHCGSIDSTKHKGFLIIRAVTLRVVVVGD